jgi:hypothetical protein
MPVAHENLQFTARRLVVFAAISLVMSFASIAQADNIFVFANKAIHPACVHALAMLEGDRMPVTSGVNLEACTSSTRSQSEPVFQDNILTFSDDAVLGGGSFGYRELSTLDNGLFILGMLRISPDGTKRVSLAAVDIVPRPTLFRGIVVNRIMLEMVGEIWIKDIRLASMRTVGNIVHFEAGAGNTRVDETVDLSRIGKARARNK